MANQQLDPANASTKSSRLTRLRTWIIARRVPFVIALFAGALSWASLTYSAQSHRPIEVLRNAKPIDIHSTLLPFPPTFAVYKVGNSLVMVRNRDKEVGFAAFMMGFCFFFLADGYIRVNPKIFKNEPIPRIQTDTYTSSLTGLFKSTIWAGGALYLWMLFVYPIMPVIMNPEWVTLDPQLNTLSFNNKVLCQMSDINYFYGGLHSGTPHYGEWGLILKNGRRIVLNDDPSIGGDVTGDSGLSDTLVSYLNNFLKEDASMDSSRATKP